METRYLLFIGGPHDGKVFAVQEPLRRMVFPVYKPSFDKVTIENESFPLNFAQVVYHLTTLWGVQFYAWEDLHQEGIAKRLLANYRPLLG